MDPDVEDPLSAANEKLIDLLRMLRISKNDERQGGPLKLKIMTATAWKVPFPQIPARASVK